MDSKAPEICYTLSCWDGIVMTTFHMDECQYLGEAKSRRKWQQLGILNQWSIPKWDMNSVHGYIMLQHKRHFPFVFVVSLKWGMFYITLYKLSDIPEELFGNPTQWFQLNVCILSHNLQPQPTKWGMDAERAV